MSTSRKNRWELREKEIFHFKNGDSSLFEIMENQDPETVPHVLVSITSVRDNMSRLFEVLPMFSGQRSSRAILASSAKSRYVDAASKAMAKTKSASGLNLASIVSSVYWKLGLWQLRY